MALHATVTDDRGRRVPLVTIDLAGSFGVTATARRESMLASATGEKRTGRDMRQALFFAALVLPLVLITVTAPLLFMSARQVPLWLILGIVLPLSLVEGWFIIQIKRRFDARTFARAAVLNGRCGSCGQSLNGLAPESDGCRVCSECGAAWR